MIKFQNYIPFPQFLVAVVVLLNLVLKQAEQLGDLFSLLLMSYSSYSSNVRSSVSD